MDAQRWISLAKAEHERGDVKAALRAVEHAMELDEHDLHACAFAAELWAELGEPGRAAALAQYVLLQNADDESLAARAEIVWRACNPKAGAQ